MPVYFQFVKNDDIQKLDSIDREICDYVGEPYDEKKYSTSYDFVTVSGIAILSRYDEINEENIDDFCDRSHDGMYKELLKEFLIRRYSFEAWWQGK